MIIFIRDREFFWVRAWKYSQASLTNYSRLDINSIKMFNIRDLDTNHNGHNRPFSGRSGDFRVR